MMLLFLISLSSFLLVSGQYYTINDYKVFKREDDSALENQFPAVVTADQVNNDQLNPHTTNNNRETGASQPISEPNTGTGKSDTGTGKSTAKSDPGASNVDVDGGKVSDTSSHVTHVPKDSSNSLHLNDPVNNTGADIAVTHKANSMLNEDGNGLNEATPKQNISDDSTHPKDNLNPGQEKDKNSDAENSAPNSNKSNNSSDERPDKTDSAPNNGGDKSDSKASHHNHQSKESDTSDPNTPIESAPDSTHQGTNSGPSDNMPINSTAHTTPPENVTTQPVADDSTSSTVNPPVTRPSSCNEDSINPTAPPDESEETIAALSIFFILVLLGVSVVMVHLFIKLKFHYLPESIGFVVIGVLVGAVFLIVKTTTGYDYQYQEKLSPQFFFLVLLPPIIFESGYSLHKGNFFQNLGSIVMFAVFGTAISAVIVGGGIYGLGVMGVIYQLDLIESFTFGSLISAVDPVATLAIFHALDVDPTLNMLVFGESVLNDAVSIVLTKAILNQLPSSTTGSSNDSAAVVLGNSAWTFVVTFFGSAVLGVLSALFSAAFLKYINLRRHQSLEFAMWVIFAFSPYFLAEGMHLSGIMAVLFCGIVMSRYTHFNLSPVTQVTVQQALRTVAFMAETGVFLYLGLAMFSIHKSFDIALIIWSLVLILLGRAANIFPITAVMNQCRSVKISLRMQCIMWYSGLRGAVAFALAQNLQEYFNKEVTGYLVTTTLVIVLFTIVILGGSTLPLLKFLKADKGAKLTLSKTEEQDTTVPGHVVERGMISKLNLHSFRGWSKAFLYLEFKYIRPVFMLTFSREEVKTARFEMQQKTVEWYQGLREASLSEEDTTDMSNTTTGSSLLHSPI